jgi:hypothetical protein
MSIEYKCKKCTKSYTTYKSLWRHDANKHKNNTTENHPSECETPTENHPNDVNIPINKCSICNINFSRKDSLTRHLKKNNCVKKVEDIEEIKKEMLEYKKEMERLKDMLQQALKVHPKTLTKINKQLNNTNNGIINNNIIVQLGRENLSDILSNKEKRGILNRQVMGINDLVELVHISGKYKKFMNVYVTNLQNTIAYRYDEKMNNFIAVNKNELLNDLIDARMYDIEKFFEEIGPTLDSKKSEKIKRFIERMNNEEDELKGIKKDEIKLVLYNNLGKIKTNEDLQDTITINEKQIDV